MDSPLPACTASRIDFPLRVMDACQNQACAPGGAIIGAKTHCRRAGGAAPAARQFAVAGRHMPPVACPQRRRPHACRRRARPARPRFPDDPPPSPFDQESLHMKTVFALFARDVRRLARNPVALVILVGALVLPSLYAWYCIAANWDPYQNTAGIRVAVANEDQGAQSDVAGHLDVGAQVVGELKDNHQLGWEFVPESEALRGVESGDYYAAIVIPADFSASFASLFTAHHERPRIDYYVNEEMNAVAVKVTDTGREHGRRPDQRHLHRHRGQGGHGRAERLRRPGEGRRRRGRRLRRPRGGAGGAGHRGGAQLARRRGRAGGLVAGRRRRLSADARRNRGAAAFRPAGPGRSLVGPAGRAPGSDRPVLGPFAGGRAGHVLPGPCSGAGPCRDRHGGRRHPPGAGPGGRHAVGRRGARGAKRGARRRPEGTRGPVSADRRRRGAAGGAECAASADDRRSAADEREREGRRRQGDLGFRFGQRGDEGRTRGHRPGAARHRRRRPARPVERAGRLLVRSRPDGWRRGRPGTRPRTGPRAAGRPEGHAVRSEGHGRFRQQRAGIHAGRPDDHRHRPGRP